MPAAVRVLNAEGLAKFTEYLADLRAAPSKTPPFELLTDGRYSDPFDPPVTIEPRSFNSAYEIGAYMIEVFEGCEDRLISRNHGLWSWLALFYFDQLCKPDDFGNRKPLEDAVYVLEERFSFRRYYRHGIRTPWVAVRLHGDTAKILLTTAGSGTKSDIGEQLGSRQHLFSNRTVISAAYELYFDAATGRPRKGAGGKGAGSARRLASIASQLELTYDLMDCPVRDFLSMLPQEFQKWGRRTHIPLHNPHATI